MHFQGYEKHLAIIVKGMFSTIAQQEGKKQAQEL